MWIAVLAEIKPASQGCTQESGCGTREPGTHFPNGQAEGLSKGRCATARRIEFWQATRARANAKLESSRQVPEAIAFRGAVLTGSVRDFLSPIRNRNRQAAPTAIPAAPLSTAP